MEIKRTWAMPNSNTFSIQPIRELIGKYVYKKKTPVIVDPFVRHSPFKDICISNDIDPTIEANFNMDALDFLKELKDSSCDIVLFDPPYSPRQVSECYKSLDMTVNMETTQSSFWTNIKTEISRILKNDGHCISFCWNSSGIGKKNCFEIVEILIVAHGGWHNDTICTVEKKMPEKQMMLFDERRTCC